MAPERTVTFNFETVTVGGGTLLVSAASFYHQPIWCDIYKLIFFNWPKTHFTQSIFVKKLLSLVLSKHSGELSALVVILQFFFF